MSRLSITRHQKDRRAIRNRARVMGTTERPRLSVHVSNLNVSVQIIDDSANKTLMQSTSAGQKEVTGTMTEKATWVGKDIAKKAKAAKITKVSFDRGSKRYHGRVKALAEAARAEGLEF
jgi:large subunit ribosomal protein L18